MKITLGWFGRLRGLAARVVAPVASEGTTDANAGTTHEAVRDFTKSLRCNGMVFKLLLKWRRNGCVEPPTIRTLEGKSINRLVGMSYLEPPADTNVVYSPHMYEPHEFTHQGVQGRPEPFPYPGAIKGREWNRKTVEETLQPVVDFQRKFGAPIFMGEFGAPRWRGEDANRYLRDVIEVCEAHGWSWAYHSYREWEGWDAERSNTNKDDRERKATTPRLELLKGYFAH